MKHVLVLMKAMPPTTGHQDLIDFAAGIGNVVLVMDYAKDEPMIDERIAALGKMVSGKGTLHTYNIEEQDPEAPGFWERWDEVLAFARRTCDYVVASEPYGAEVARRINARFLPYDPKRELNPIKATLARENPVMNWDYIAPEFRPYLMTTVTVFGAESNGKTTFAKDLAYNFGSKYKAVFEWARPYLETVGPDITVDSMTDIWKGQRSVQMLFKAKATSRLLVQDTDLFSTVGYWEQPHWQDTLGEVPSRLYVDAQNLKSDLYIILKSNIDFEADPIRYGGDHRESGDDYWIALAEREGLNYVVLESSRRDDRVDEAVPAVMRAILKKLVSIQYDRKGF